MALRKAIVTTFQVAKSVVYKADDSKCLAPGVGRTEGLLENCDFASEVFVYGGKLNSS